jgi:hypothetical protein
VIGAVRASPLGETFRPGSLMNKNAGAVNNWTEAYYTKTEKIFAQLLFNAAVFVLYR